MSLFDIYKAKTLGAGAGSLFDAAIGKSLGTAYEWITESVPYTLRQSANGANIAPKCVDKIIGGSINWNQLIDRNDIEAENSGIFITIGSNHELVINGKSTSGSWSTYVYAKNSVAFIKDHKYMLIGCPSGGSSTTYRLWTNSSSAFPYGNRLEDTGKGVIKIARANETLAASELHVEVSKNAGDVTNLIFTPLLCDITAAFGSVIADYIYTLEQSQAGSGVAKLKSWGFFSESYYDIDEGSLQSVNTSAHVMRDDENNVIGNYALDNTLVLRGIAKLDSNNNLYYDGDVYEGNGTVTRKYDIRAFESGDATDGSTMITDGTNTVYKLTTPTTETADLYQSAQSVAKGGTEEYVDYAVSQGTRDVSIPVGHNTQYKVFS